MAHDPKGHTRLAAGHTMKKCCCPTAITIIRMSTTKVLPQTWPPFERAQWDERARSMLSSLSMMGEEDEARTPGAVNSSVGEFSDVLPGPD